MKNILGFTHLVIVILISVMAVGLVVVAWYYEENKEEITISNTSATTNTNTVKTITNIAVNTNTITKETDNWLTYKNEEVGFSFRYPAEWGAVIRDEVKNNIYGLSGKQFLLTASNFDTWQGHFDEIPIIHITSTDYQKPDHYAKEGEGFLWNNGEGPAEICQEVAKSLDASTQCSALEGSNTYILTTAVVYSESTIVGFSGIEDWIWYERHAFIPLDSSGDYRGVHLRYSIFNEQNDELLTFTEEQIQNYGESNLPLIINQFPDKIKHFDNLAKTVSSL